ncbi:MAG TPA: TIGR03885 family FMN-dependent LLM class oxidoreductase [Polyangiaceae bacterium]|nr:TIGR03885 family FMN-dependent LLM class oxidoreductase [Polyangiaceae bacterium]
MLPVLGFHASHEQFPPSELLALAQQSESLGFRHGMCSDHFSPFSEAQGQSGFAWSWLGAALAATNMTWGVVNAPGQRYHPAIVAQAAATLAEMFPGRFWLALGSGENINEHITGDRWPPKDERQARLRECVDIIRALFGGETVTYRGLVRVEDARLYTLPKTPPLLFAAAVSAETAAWAGEWADGLITVNQPEADLRRVVEGFRRRGGEARPIYLQAHVSFAPTLAAARATAHAEWRSNALTGSLLWDVRLPKDLDGAAQYVRQEDLDSSVRIAANLEEHVAWLLNDSDLGFDRVYLHQVGRNQSEFLQVFGRDVLPRCSLIEGPASTRYNAAASGIEPTGR